MHYEKFRWNNSAATRENNARARAERAPAQHFWAQEYSVDVSIYRARFLIAGANSPADSSLRVRFNRQQHHFAGIRHLTFSDVRDSIREFQCNLRAAVFPWRLSPMRRLGRPPRAEIVDSGFKLYARNHRSREAVGTAPIARADDQSKK